MAQRFETMWKAMRQEDKHEEAQSTSRRSAARGDGRWRTGIGIAILGALPAIALVVPVIAGARAFRFVLDPSGWIATGLLVAVLAISPLRTLFPGSSVTAWLVRHRRRLGLATFFYACVHMVFFVLAVGSLADIVSGLAWASMWTGWVSFLMLAMIAAISSDVMRRLMGRAWKPIQRLAYAAAVLALAHWLLLAGKEWLPLAVAGLLILLEGIRIAKGPGKG